MHAIQNEQACTDLCKMQVVRFQLNFCVHSERELPWVKPTHLKGSERRKDSSELTVIWHLKC